MAKYERERDTMMREWAAKKLQRNWRGFSSRRTTGKRRCDLVRIIAMQRFVRGLIGRRVTERLRFRKRVGARVPLLCVRFPACWCT